MATLNEREVFMGVKFVTLETVLDDGAIWPVPSKPVTDVLRPKRAFHIGPSVYTVVNLTRGYQCFVQFRRGPKGEKWARCDHENCRWQSRVANPKPCKHIRRACVWHVKLLSRRPELRQPAKPKYEEGEPCPNCTEGHLVRFEHEDDWYPREGQTYYYEWWFKCNKCLNTFNDDRAKRPTDQWRALSA